MESEARPARALKPAPDWELVLKRNPVERIKREKAPLGIRDELPALIAAGYEAVAEEDVFASSGGACITTSRRWGGSCFG